MKTKNAWSQQIGAMYGHPLYRVEMPKHKGPTAWIVRDGKRVALKGRTK